MTNNVFNIAVNIKVNNAIHPQLARTARGVQGIGASAQNVNKQLVRTNQLMKSIGDRVESLGNMAEGAFLGMVVAGVVNQLVKAIELAKELSRVQRAAQSAGQSLQNTAINQRVVHDVSRNNTSLGNVNSQILFNEAERYLNNSNAAAVMPTLAPFANALSNAGVKIEEYLPALQNLFRLPNMMDANGNVRIKEFEKALEDLYKTLAAGRFNAEVFKNAINITDYAANNARPGSPLDLSKSLPLALMPGGTDALRIMNELVSPTGGSPDEVKMRKARNRWMGWDSDDKTGGLGPQALQSYRSNPLAFIEGLFARLRERVPNESVERKQLRAELLASGLGDVFRSFMANPTLWRNQHEAYTRANNHTQDNRNPRMLVGGLAALEAAYNDLFGTIGNSQTTVKAIYGLSNALRDLNTWASDPANTNKAEMLAGGLGGGLGGATTGAVVGMMAGGPFGMFAGALIGGIAGTLAGVAATYDWTETFKSIKDGFDYFIKFMLTWGGTINNAIFVPIKNFLVGGIQLLHDALKTFSPGIYEFFKSIVDTIKTFTTKPEQYGPPLPPDISPRNRALQRGRVNRIEGYDEEPSDADKPTTLGFNWSDVNRSLYMPASNQTRIENVILLDGREVSRTVNDYNVSGMRSRRNGTRNPSRLGIQRT